MAANGRRTSTGMVGAEMGLDRRASATQAMNTKQSNKEPIEQTASEMYWSERRQDAHEILTSSHFDIVIGVVITLNAITIGLEQSFRVAGHDVTFFHVLEHMFLVVYAVELGLRFFVFGLSCLQDNWVRFDMLLVTSGVFINWILEPIMAHSQKAEAFGQLLVLRTVRLFRLGKAIRLLASFRELWMLIRGLMNSARTLMYTVILLCVILYIYGCIGVELITFSRLNEPGVDPDFKEQCSDSHFTSLPVAMMTLIQFVTLDDMSMIYKPCIEKDWFLFFYFASLIAVVSVVLMNVITAVVVSSELEQALLDKQALKTHEEEEQRALIRNLRVMFRRLDEDQSGQLTRDEMNAVTGEDKIALCAAVGVDNPMEIFDALDVASTGAIGIEEFCNGVWQAMSTGAPLQAKRMERQVNAMFAKTKEAELTATTMHRIMNSVSRTNAVMEKVVREMDTVKALLKEASIAGSIWSRQVTPDAPDAKKAPNPNGIRKRNDIVDNLALWETASSIAPSVKSRKASKESSLAEDHDVPSETVVRRRGSGLQRRPTKESIVAGESDLGDMPSWANEILLELHRIRADGVRLATDNDAWNGSLVPATSGRKSMARSTSKLASAATDYSSTCSRGSSTVDKPVRRVSPSPPGTDAAAKGASGSRVKAGEGSDMAGSSPFAPMLRVPRQHEVASNGPSLPATSGWDNTDDPIESEHDNMSLGRPKLPSTVLKDL
eukprot:gnl/TRDRNA2_/TRDRNA2_150792_c0_seq1.p1 gnl/TRDRNA2_/TRDRNA2_150792_c0~~gnl/TRDRNA2_/TRDRNA2_150792_c0_seq1.p1  ORF type:complete len:721 (+),score=115.27 gnl/TRDRNA2_/TRDRNA2_150792_c0_seq1:107-2269(+)